jgi:hypothetical protein
VSRLDQRQRCEVSLRSGWGLLGRLDGGAHDDDYLGIRVRSV